ncbi:hypothetical protein CRE_15765 [Caenorhabditis remanei]|uniref:Uncharacterized protein n=1 Tax=Caenorhabditis remanei TaxID=31234 RepID=E3NKC9_CAERE|nr:hypothetical protein CRE_15765 [Caenorhabditis remanei]
MTAQQIEFSMERACCLVVANLIPRGNNPSLKSLKDESSSKQAPPTAQTPPSRTPVERSGTPEEDTLANVKSLPPEKSDAPLSGKKRKH